MFGKLRIKGFKGVDGDFDLAPLTVFVGDMTEGKTLFLEAMQLALRGEIAGVGAKALVEFTSPPDTLISIEGSGRVGTYALPWEDGKPKYLKAEHSAVGFDPASVLPVVSLSALANGGPALEAAILGRFGQGALQLPESVHDVVAEEWPVASKTAVFSVAGAGDFLAHVKREINALGRQASALEKRAAETEVSATDAADLVMVEQELRHWDRAVAQYGDKWIRAYVPEESVREARKCRDAAARAKEQLEKITAALNVQTALLDLAQAAARAGKDTLSCPVCGGGEMQVQAEVQKRKAKVAVIQTRIAKLRADVAMSKRAQTEAIERHRPDIDALRRRQQALTQTAARQDMQTGWMQEAIALRQKQQDLQNAAKAVKVALDGNRKSAYAAASMRIDELSFPEFELGLRSEGPKWVVHTRGGPRFASVSGSQRMSVALASPLVFAGGEGPRVVLLDDEEFAGFSRAGAKALLRHFADLVQRGLISQVVATHHTDKADEIPPAYKIIKI